MPRGPVACELRSQRFALGALIRGLRRAFSAVPYSAYEKYASVGPASEGSGSLPVSAPSPCSPLAREDLVRSRATGNAVLRLHRT